MQDYSFKKISKKSHTGIIENVDNIKKILFSVSGNGAEECREYAEKIITFEFSHFLSPQSIYPSARNLNRLYKDFYKRNK